MRLQSEEIKNRTKKFALEIINLYRQLPKTEESRVIGRQLLKSGTSVAANYRAVCRARSQSEFIAKMGIVVEEADETVFWLELLYESSILPRETANGLLKEANELLSIFASSHITAKSAISK